MAGPAVFAFVTLFVTIGPIENAATFALLTADLRARNRTRLAARSVTIAAAVLLVFAFGGRELLKALQISFSAFRFAGGLLLLIQAIDLVLVHPTGLSTITRGEEREAALAADIAVFPLAIPLIAGPGSMTAIVLLIDQAGSDYRFVAIILAMLALVLALTYLAMRFVEPIEGLLGITGTNVVARISGILLAALAVQFLFDGIKSARLF